MRGLFVTGTGTGVGKTVVAAAILTGLAARGERCAAFKPVITGLDDPSGEWPPDHELLAAAAGGRQTPEEVCPHRFGPAASPHLAAEQAGQALDPDALLAAARGAAAGADALVCEGAGGLLVPLADRFLVRDLAAALALPLVVAARPGLGTINHTLLTLEAARAAGLAVAAVVLTPWPARPSAIERSNRATLARLGAAPICALAGTSPGGLKAAGASLPLGRWLGDRGGGMLER